jgi:hypothetical protein
MAKGDNGPYIYALYSVSPDEATIGVNQSVQATPNADKDISHMTFFGVPEPSTWALLLIGSALFVCVRRRRCV